MPSYLISYLDNTQARLGDRGILSEREIKNKSIHHIKIKSAKH